MSEVNKDRLVQDLEDAGCVEISREMIEVDGFQYTAVIGKDGDNFVGSVEGIIEANSIGKTKEELLKNLVVAAEAVLEVLNQISQAEGDTDIFTEEFRKKIRMQINQAQAAETKKGRLEKFVEMQEVKYEWEEFFEEKKKEEEKNEEESFIGGAGI